MEEMCITGHRPKTIYSYNYDAWCWDPFKEFVSTMLRDVSRENGRPINVWSGMALGVDQVAAQCVLHVRDLGYPVTLSCAIPCLEYTEMWNYNSKKIYNDILSKADNVVVVTEDYYTPYCLSDRNKYMIDRSDCLVAFVLEPDGGTWDGVRYARKRNIPVHLIHPYTLQVRDDL